MMMKKPHIVSALLVLSLLLAQPLVATEPKETKRVLVLYGEGKALPAHELTDQGLRAAASRGAHTRAGKAFCLFQQRRSRWNFY